MADEKNYPTYSPTRDLRSSPGKIEWRYELRTLQREFPTCGTLQIEAALQKALDAIPPEGARRDVELAARSDLVFQSLAVSAKN
jgi:hypothetical protein